MRIIYGLLFFLQCQIYAQSTYNINLNGKWDCGENRKYTREVNVPGLASDPTKMNANDLWYKRQVKLPNGDWTKATLLLKGARFMPKVYVDGNLVSEQAGGMAPTLHALTHENIKPGNTVTIEIVLASLKDMPERDASRIPKADYWRSNIASHLWDDVVLKLHGNASLEHVNGYKVLKDDEVKIKYRINNTSKKDFSSIAVAVLDSNGKEVLKKEYRVSSSKGELTLKASGKLKLWEPDTPNLYKLVTKLKKGNKVIDIDTCNYGHRAFKVKGKQFELNGHPTKFRAASVVWYRWLRYAEVKELAWDTQWFEEHIVKRLKAHGANTLRFHLGMPPQKFLDLCDKYGLFVQAEWHFFHGMEASKNSLLEQWSSWFDVSSRYPSNVLMHGWNETEGDRLKIAYDAISEVAKDYPGLVIGHRDVTHIHKYWWSLFENVGLFYDSFDQFELPVMADEYGGNYLDEYGNVGGYPMVASAYNRFLGANHTKAQRFYHHALSNAKISEYWRIIDVAGFSPFCVLGSKEDGNHWFLGDIKQGNPMPVWNALTAAWSPISANLNIWDRNFTPGQDIELPIVLFNDTAKEVTIRVKYSIENPTYRQATTFEIIEVPVKKYSKLEKKVNLKLPATEGHWLIKAEVLNPPAGVKHPIVSEWDIRTIVPKVAKELANLSIGVFDEDKHLHNFLTQNNLNTVPAFDKAADIIVLSKNTWDAKMKSPQFMPQIEQQISKGKHVVFLDAGPNLLGQGYERSTADLQGVRKSSGGIISKASLPFGVKALFKEAAEPESHIHPTDNNVQLWNNIPREATWMWNGLKGGLIVPSVDFELSGLSASSFLETWKAKGAAIENIKKEDYYSYELEGFYAFSTTEKNSVLKDSLRQSVKFLVEDAPALKLRINPDAKIIVRNLNKAFKESKKGKASALLPLVSAGRNLKKKPVYAVEFAKGYGKVIISQLITDGRLHRTEEKTNKLEKKYDAAAAQMVLNMLEYVIK